MARFMKQRAAIKQRRTHTHIVWRRRDQQTEHGISADNEPTRTSGGFLRSRDGDSAGKSSSIALYSGHQTQRIGQTQRTQLRSTTTVPLNQRQTVLPTEFFLCGSPMLGSRVVSVLDSGSEGPVFKSQSRRCRVTVLGKLFTPIVPLFTKQQNR